MANEIKKYRLSQKGVGFTEYYSNFFEEFAGEFHCNESPDKETYLFSPISINLILKPRLNKKDHNLEMPVKQEKDITKIIELIKLKRFELEEISQN